MDIAKRDVGLVDGMGLADAIGLLREELLEAQAAGADSGIQLPVESVTVELMVAATSQWTARQALRSRSWTWSWAGAWAGSTGQNRE